MFGEKKQSASNFDTKNIPLEIVSIVSKYNFSRIGNNPKKQREQTWEEFLRETTN
jgi:hypothetical protein